MELTQIIQTMELFSINLIGPPQLNELTQYSVALGVRLCLSCFCHTRYMIGTWKINLGKGLCALKRLFCHCITIK